MLTVFPQQLSIALKSDGTTRNSLFSPHQKVSEYDQEMSQSQTTDQSTHGTVKKRYSKTCLKRPLKIDKTKVLLENGSLMVESIAECSHWSILQYF